MSNSNKMATSFQFISLANYSKEIGVSQIKFGAVVDQVVKLNAIKSTQSNANAIPFCIPESAFPSTFVSVGRWHLPSSYKESTSKATASLESMVGSDADKIKSMFIVTNQFNLIQAFNQAFPKTRLFGLKPTCTPFVNAKPNTLFYDAKPCFGGAIGIAFKETIHASLTHSLVPLDESSCIVTKVN